MLDSFLCFFRGVLKKRVATVAFRFSIKKVLETFLIFERVVLVFAVAIVILRFIYGMVNIPCTPTDAVVYHIPRAYLYYKRETIHNMPVPYGHFLYLAPLNAILMSQIQILSFGSDRLFFLVQFSSYIVSALSIYLIAKKLGATIGGRLFSGVAVILMPLACVQSTTEQNDLLVVAFCGCFVYYVIEYVLKIEGEDIYIEDYCLIGISAALVILSKISGAVVIAPFGILWVVSYLKKKDSIKRLVLCAICALFIVIGYWIRNAVDLRGDFLAFSYGHAMLDLNPPKLALLSVENIISTLSGPFAVQQKIIMSIVNKFSNVLNLDMQATTEGGIPFSPITQYGSADGCPYFIHSFLGLVSIVGMTFVWFKKRRKEFYICLCLIISLCLSSISYVWCLSVLRYMMPVFILMIPFVTVFCEYLVKQNNIRHIVFGIVELLMLLYCFFFVNPAGFLKVESLKNIETSNYAMYDNNPQLVEWIDGIKEYVDDNKMKRIGVYESSRGIGPLSVCIRPFLEYSYDIRVIKARFHEKKEDEDFHPDVIIAGYAVDEIPKKMEYNGLQYQLEGEPHGAFSTEIDSNDWVLNRTYNLYLKKDE